MLGLSPAHKVAFLPFVLPPDTAQLPLLVSSRDLTSCAGTNLASTCTWYRSSQKVLLLAATVSLIRKCFLTWDGTGAVEPLFRDAVKPFPLKTC